MKYLSLLLVLTMILSALLPLAQAECGGIQFPFGDPGAFFGADGDVQVTVIELTDDELNRLLNDSASVSAPAQGQEYVLDSGWVLTWYPGYVIQDCGDGQKVEQLSQQPSAQEIDTLVQWLEENLDGLTEGAVPDTAAFDPAVYQTAIPQAEPTPAPTAAPVKAPAAVQCPAAVKATTAPQPAPTKAPVTQQPISRPTAQPTAAPTVSTGDYTTITASAQEQKLLNLLNADRAKNGLPPLALDPELSRLARMKSQDFDDNAYFGHESPVYGNAAQMLDTFQYDYRGVGENIAHYGSVEKAEAAFMSSEGHRRNILGSQWDKVGIGITYDENGFLYVTQLFAR